MVEPRQSLSTKAVRGASWTIATSIGSRALGLVGTLAITYFLVPDIIGEVSDASILVLTANQLSTIGVGNYLIAKPDAGRDVTWHATVFHLSLGLLALGLVVLMRNTFAHVLHAPTMGSYVPGLAVSVVFDRIGFIPERLLVRRMNFRVIGISRTVGEITYSVASVGLAMLGFGGAALVWANILRSLLRMIMMCGAVDYREWLTPSPLSKATTKVLMNFGLPFSVNATAGFAARRWDNLLISNMFGPGVLGQYNLAYNLADIPAVQVGEQIGDVLLPSFASLPLEQRKTALVRSTGLLALVVFPLAVGLGAVAPTVVHTLLRKEWVAVGPMLMLLSALSVVRPIGWTISAYLVARELTRPLMWLGLAKVVFLLGCIATIGRLGPLWACGAVGVAFALDAVASLGVVTYFDGIPMRKFFMRCAPPLLACVPMVIAVYLARLGCQHFGIEIRGVDLAIELVAGALGYILGAFLVARSIAMDFVTLMKKGLGRGKKVAVV
jgi:PST family polysaccharide transporter